MTGTGQAFYERCRRLIADWADAESLVADTHGALSGTLRVATPVTFGMMYPAPVLTEFKQQHPDGTVDVDFSDRHVNLIEDGFDVAVRIARVTDSSLSPGAFARSGWSRAPAPATSRNTASRRHRPSSPATSACTTACSHKGATGTTRRPTAAPDRLQ